MHCIDSATARRPPPLLQIYLQLISKLADGNCETRYQCTVLLYSSETISKEEAKIIPKALKGTELRSFFKFFFTTILIEMETLDANELAQKQQNAPQRLHVCKQ